MEKWIDTHCHTYMETDSRLRAALVKRSVDAGVDKFLQAGVDLDSIAPIETICKEFPQNSFASIGLHPSEVRENYMEVLAQIEQEILKPRLKYVAIGEIGFDLYWDKTFLEEQKKAFAVQIHWAKELDLPVSLHIRDAYEPFWEVLRKEKIHTLKGVLHCFGGGIEEAKKACDMGLVLGVGGVLTFKNARQLPLVVKETPLEQLVLETDAPYLAPVPHRGQPNESSYIPLIGARMAEIKEEPVSRIAEITTRNAETLFAFGGDLLNQTE